MKPKITWGYNEKKDFIKLVPAPEPGDGNVQGLKTCKNLLDAIMEKHRNQKIIYGAIIDLDTTGLREGFDEIIAISLHKFAYVKDINQATPLLTGEIYESYSEPGLLDLHAQYLMQRYDISETDLSGKHMRVDEICRFLENVSFIISHNAAFDAKFLRKLLPEQIINDKWWCCTQKDLYWKKRNFHSDSLRSLVMDHGMFLRKMNCFHRVRALIAILSKKVDRESLTTNFQELIYNCKQPVWQITVSNSSYDSKDLLKNLEFRWQPSLKTWYKNVMDEEKDLLVRLCSSSLIQVCDDHQATVNVYQINRKMMY